MLVAEATLAHREREALRANAFKHSQPASTLPLGSNLMVYPRLGTIGEWSVAPQGALIDHRAQDRLLRH